MKKYYGVHQVYYDNGDSEISLTERYFDSEPERTTVTEYRKFRVCVDWFDTKREAKDFLNLLAS